MDSTHLSDPPPRHCSGTAKRLDILCRPEKTTPGSLRSLIPLHCGGANEMFSVFQPRRDDQVLQTDIFVARAAVTQVELSRDCGKF